MYDSSIFGIIRSLSKSGRGELEITEANSIMVKNYNSSWYGGQMREH